MQGTLSPFHVHVLIKAVRPGWAKNNLTGCCLYFLHLHNLQCSSQCLLHLSPFWVNKQEWMLPLIIGIKAGCCLVIWVYRVGIKFLEVLGTYPSFPSLFQFYVSYHFWIRYLCLWRSVIHPRKVMIFWIYNESHEWFKCSNDKLSFVSVCNHNVRCMPNRFFFILSR